MIGKQIPEISLDSVEGWNGEAVDPGRSRGRVPAAKESRPRSRGRGRGRGTGEADSPAEPIEIQAIEDGDAEEKAARTKRTGRTARASNGTRRGEKRPSDEPSRATKSFGDHTPAFILRPVA
jgi:hypothetical protein